MKKWLHFVFVDMTAFQWATFGWFCALISCMWSERWLQAIFLLLARSELLKYLEDLVAEQALEKAAAK